MPEELRWFAFIRRRGRRAGDRNGSTLTGRYHAARVDMAEARAASASLRRYAVGTLCGRYQPHVEADRFVGRVPERGPLGGTVKVCVECRREVEGG